MRDSTGDLVICQRKISYVQGRNLSCGIYAQKCIGIKINLPGFCAVHLSNVVSKKSCTRFTYNSKYIEASFTSGFPVTQARNKRKLH